MSKYAYLSRLCCLAFGSLRYAMYYAIYVPILYLAVALVAVHISQCTVHYYTGTTIHCTVHMHGIL